MNNFDSLIKLFYKILNNAATADLKKKKQINQRWRPAAIFVVTPQPLLGNRPLAEHMRQVSRKSHQWSRRRFDMEIVTVLNKGQLVI